MTCNYASTKLFNNFLVVFMEMAYQVHSVHQVQVMAVQEDWVPIKIVLVHHLETCMSQPTLVVEVAGQAAQVWVVEP